MKTSYIYIMFVFCALKIQAQTKFESSQLPVIELLTNGKAIVENKKIVVTMRVHDRKDGQQNKLTDVPTYESTIGIEHRGQTSFFLSDKKPYNIEIRNQDGTKQVEAPLLDLPKDSDWAILAPFTDKTLIREAFMYRIGQQMMPFAPHFRFAEIVLNGSYKGIFMVTEKLNRSKARIDVDKMLTTDIDGDELTGGYIFALDKTQPGDQIFLSAYSYPVPKGRRPEYVINYPKATNLQSKQKNYIQNWVNDFEKIMDSPNYNDSLKGYEQYLDVPSFVDYTLLQELSKNVDAYRLSTVFAKDKDSKSKKMRIASIWDFNIALDNANFCVGKAYEGWAYNFNDRCPSDYWVISSWWLKLLEDQKFQLAQKKRWQTLRKTLLSDANLMATIDSLTNTIGTAAVDRNFTEYPILNQFLWPNPGRYFTHEGEIAHLKSWLKNRTRWLDGAYNAIKENTTPTESKNVILYPNPVGNIFNVDFFTNFTSQNVTLNIYNTQGQIALSKAYFFESSGFQQCIFDSEQLTKGAYIYELIYEDKKVLGKLMK